MSDGVKVVDFKDSTKKSAPKPSLEETKASLDIVRKSLPIYAERKQLLDAVRKHQNLIVVGETGSGKTTQLPQYLLESGFCQRGRIIGCTQPRRVAAITVAQRVAQERGTELGDEVGYTIRFEDRTSSATKIKYLTDGMLLREIQVDPELSRYSVILLDEAHERTMNTDILFALLKRLQATKRPDLKLIIMSATLDAEKFSEYFNNAPVAIVPGRTFKVDVFYTDKPQVDYQNSCVTAVLQLHLEKPIDGDILVFLPGAEEIENVKATLEERAKLLPEECPGLHVVALYSQLSPDQQLEAFKPAPEGCRKVVVATNVAETSVTLSGIKYVIDSGIAKVRTYDTSRGSGTSTGFGIERLKPEPISRAESWQRAGRCGRERDGECYRLYPEEEFKLLKPTVVPEILRSPLSTVVLALKALNIDDVLGFDFLDRPSTSALREATKELLILGALDERLKITELGRNMTRLPIEPAFSKMLLVSANPPNPAAFSPCSLEMATLIAAMNVDTLFIDTSRAKPDLQRRATQARARFLSEDGDLMTALNIMTAYSKVREHKRVQWARDNFLNIRNLETARQIRDQLIEGLEGLGFPIISCVDSADSFNQFAKSDSFLTPTGALPTSDSGVSGPGVEVVRSGPSSDWGLRKDPKEDKYYSVRRCLVTGMFNRVVKRQPDGSYRTLSGGLQVHIHPTSTLNAFRHLLSQNAWLKQQAVLTTQLTAQLQSAAPGAKATSLESQIVHPLDCMIYTAIVDTSKHYIRGMVAIDYNWLAELAPMAFSTTEQMAVMKSNANQNLLNSPMGSRATTAVTSGLRKEIAHSIAAAHAASGGSLTGTAVKVAIKEEDRLSAIGSTGVRSQALAHRQLLSPPKIKPQHTQHTPSKPTNQHPFHSPILGQPRGRPDGLSPAQQQLKRVK